MLKSKKQILFKDFKVQLQHKTDGKTRRTPWENPLRCCICFEKLKDPKLLRCFHTFCESCLEKFIGLRLEPCFNCPLCLSNIDLPETEVKGLPDNFYVQAYNAVKASKNPCELCELDNDVLSRCMECNANMCVRCRTTHQKAKTTRSHKIVMLSDYEKKVTARVSKKLLCKKHSNEELRFLCSSCDELVCQECSDGEHNDHTTTEVAEIYVERKARTSKLVETIRAYLPYVKNNIEQADKETDKLKIDVSKTKEIITEHAEQLKKEIDKICNNKLEEIDDVLKEYLESIELFRKDMERMYFSIKTLAEMSEQMLEIASDKHFMQINKNLEKRLESVPTEIPNCSLQSARTEFTPNDSRILDNSFGTNALSVVTVLQFSPADNKVPTFLCPGRPYTICPISTSEAWIVCDTPNAITLYSKDGTIRKVLSMPGEVNDVCYLPDGSLYVSELRGKTIWKVGTDNVAKTLTCLEEAVRGVTGKGDRLFVTRRVDSHQMVSMLQEDGSVIKDIIMDNGLPIFGHPDRLALTNDGLICVTDRGRDGAVIFVTVSGRVISVYKGDQELQERFEPWGLCVDHRGYVFVTDRFNNCVHLLDGEGSLLKHILNQDDGVRRPLGVAVDEQGHLWVGNEDGSVKVFNYLELLP